MDHSTNQLPTNFNLEFEWENTDVVMRCSLCIPFEIIVNCAFLIPKENISDLKRTENPFPKMSYDILPFTVPSQKHFLNFN